MDAAGRDGSLCVELDLRRNREGFFGVREVVVADEVEVSEDV